MKFLRVPVFIVFLLPAVLPVPYLTAQEAAGSDGGAAPASDIPAGDAVEAVEAVDAPGVQELLESALTAAERGEWAIAEMYLDQAAVLDPGDPRIESYRASFRELAALDDAQGAWAEGTPTEVKRTGTGDDDTGETGGEEDEEPKFVIDRGDRNPGESPVLTRDLLRSEIALRLLSVDPLDSESRTTWSSSEEFFYASLGVDLAYWMPVLRRSLGFNFRSSGYSYRPGDPDLLFNTLDMGLNLRGFLLESKTSRLELGIDFGGSLQNTRETGVHNDPSWAFYLGMWVSDPLFYHLFNADSVENLLFGGGIRIYSSASEDILEKINYRLDGSWIFGGMHVGVRLDWWNFVVNETQTNMMSVALTGGFRY